MGLRISRRSWVPDCACHHYAEYLSSDPAAFPRSRRAQRTGDSSAGNFAGQSADPVRSQLPAHVPVGDRGGWYRCADPAPNNLSTAERGQECRLTGFRFFSAHPGCAIPLRPAIDSRTTRQHCRTAKCKLCCGSRHPLCSWRCRVGIHLYDHPDCTSPARWRGTSIARPRCRCLPTCW